ncbi:hypothetical protein NZK32_00330 [Cyanobium sp. FGCU-52]|nr:hypothetical protein [Cyanobium sp. FGCU52]
MVLSWRQLASLLGPPGPLPPLTAWLTTPQAGERRILLRAPQALTISRLDAVLTGGSSPSVSVSLRHGADVSAAGTAVTSTPLAVSSTTTGTTTSSLLNAQLPADHWLWLEITAVSGSPAAVAVVVAFS